MLSMCEIALIAKAAVPSFPPARWWMLWWTVQPSIPTTPHAYLRLGVFCCASKAPSLLVEAPRLGLEVGCFHGKRMGAVLRAGTVAEALQVPTFTDDVVPCAGCTAARLHAGDGDASRLDVLFGVCVMSGRQLPDSCAAMRDTNCEGGKTLLLLQVLLS